MWLLYPTGTGKMGRHFQSGKSRGILNRLEKSGKITQNTFKQMSFVIFSDIKKNGVLFLKWIKFLFNKNKTLKD